jgi:Tc5 transposase DNA-binding domain
MGLILEFFVKLGQSFFQEKAREIANLFGLNGFKASSGWLTRFKLRHSISLKRIQGEAGDIDD